MQCTKHPFDRAHDVCSHCGDTFCRPCLVYPLGERKAGFCINCTLVRSGVRTRGGMKPVKGRELRQRRKQLAAALADSHQSAHFIEFEPIDEVQEEDLMAMIGEAEAVIDWQQ